jgi:hypothetical protein
MESPQNIQTIAIIIQTVTLIATLIVVWRYTSETAKLRRASEEQSMAFRNQVRIAQEHLALEKKQAVELARPRLDASSSTSGDNLTIELKNHGRITRGLRVTLGNKNSLILERRYLDPDQRYPFNVRRSSAVLPLRAEYFDGIGTKYVVCYEVHSDGVKFLSEKNSFENPELS